MSRNKNKNRLTNDLDSEEQDYEYGDDFYDSSFGEKKQKKDLNPKQEAFRRNAWVVGAFMFIAVLWHFDWNPMKAAYGIGSAITDVFETEEPTNISQTQSTTATDLSQLDYYDQIKDFNFDGSPSLQNTQILYQNGVTVEYLRDLDRIGFLSDLTPNQVMALFSNGVTTDYIEKLEELDYLDEVNYSGVIGLYANGVTKDYLQTLENVDYLDEISYSGIIGLYANGVTESYLETLEDVDYLDEVSYSGIIGMYANGVSEDLLRQLDDRDLLEDMSYSEVIRFSQGN